MKKNNIQVRNNEGHLLESKHNIESVEKILQTITEWEKKYPEQYIISINIINIKNKIQ